MRSRLRVFEPILIIALLAIPAVSLIWIVRGTQGEARQTAHTDANPVVLIPFQQLGT